MKSSGILATLNFLCGSSRGLRCSSETILKTTTGLFSSFLSGAQLHGLRLHISASDPSLSLVRWLVSLEWWVVCGVERALLAGDGELQDLKCVTASGTCRSKDFLLAHVNAMLGCNAEALGGILAQRNVRAVSQDALSVCQVKLVDGEAVVTATVQEHLFVLPIEEEVGDTRATEERSLHQRLFQVAHIPNTILANDFFAEASRDNRVVVDPVDSLHFRTNVRGCAHSSTFRAGVENKHLLLLAHTTNHFAIGAPLDVSAVVVSELSKSDDGFIELILVDIPDLNSLVDRVSGH